MARAEIPIVVLNSTTGLPVSGASVAVKFRSSGLNATWWTQETGGTSSTASVTTDSSGRVSAWVDRGAYNCTVSGTGITTYTEPFDAAPAADNSIDALWLPDNVIAARHLADGVVGNAELAANSVDTSKIVDGTIAPADLSAASLASFLRFASGSGYKIAIGSSTLAITAATAGTTTVTHGLGATPLFAAVSPSGVNLAGTGYSFNGTNFTAAISYTAGGTVTLASVAFTWIAIG